MFTNNPFAELSASMPPAVRQTYVVIMIDRLLVSGTKLRKWLSEGSPVPPEFSRPEVLEVLRAYYAGLDR